MCNVIDLENARSRRFCLDTLAELARIDPRITDRAERLARLEEQEVKVYTAEEVAKLLGTSKRAVWGWIRDGKLGAVLVSKKAGYRISEADLVAWYEANRVVPGQEAPVENKRPGGGRMNAQPSEEFEVRQRAMRQVFGRDLQAWCAERGIPVTPEARARFFEEERQADQERTARGELPEYLPWFLIEGWLDQEEDE